MSPLFKILFVFCLIIYMLRKRIGLGITMLVSTVIVGFLFSLDPLDIIQEIAKTLVTPSTVELIVALVLIMVLEAIMRQTGMLQAMTDALFKLVRNPSILVASIPAIIGFLPSAGGARFSAPLVDQATIHLPYKVRDKVFINYWFRHIWEYSLPLYPGLLLAAHISGLPLSKILLWQWPFSVIWALLGYWYVFRHYKLDCESKLTNQSDKPKNQESFKTFITNTWPLWATVIMVLCKIPIVISLITVLLLLIFSKRHPFSPIWGDID